MFKFFTLLVSLSFLVSNVDYSYGHYAESVLSNEGTVFKFDSSSDTRDISNMRALFDQTKLSVVFIHGRFGGAGSGIIVGPNEILTNHHVVEHAANVTYQLFDEDVTVIKQLAEEPIYDAEVIAIDPKRDLALLKTKKRLWEQVRFSPDWKIKITGDVYAIGHPRRLLWTYTEGVISALPMSYEWNAGDSIDRVANVIQTQTPINPGNSGGALFNMDGELVGVNSFLLPGNQGLNFAVRIDEVFDFMRKAERGDYPKGEETEVVSRQLKNSEIYIQLKKWRDYFSSDSVVTMEATDTDLDGSDDFWKIFNNKGNLIYVVIDTQGPFIFFDSEAGQKGLYFYDYDRDGVFDEVAYDGDDEDFYPDTYLSYAEYLDAQG